ncbi:hypothetical protein [Pseudomonas orientalis]|uniref:hypothetical protein n=1 Tax=Pseudomonas orientalis TaxID=76758 RepID=UPI000F572199|nr:hypothetical protein [Pseudomonas orientalis]
MFGLLSCCLQSGYSSAAWEFTCTSMTAPDGIDLGEIESRKSISFSMATDCKVSKDIPGGTYLTHTQTYTSGTGPAFEVVDMTGVGAKIPQAQWAGGSSRACRPFSCSGMLPKQVLGGQVYMAGVSGSAADLPGTYELRFALISNKFGLSEADTLMTTKVKYVIPVPACALSSGPSVSLPFGTLNSDDFASAERIAEMSFDCTGTLDKIVVVLVPNESVISGSVGVSATTLEGLSMAVRWVDNDTPVAFSTPRFFTMHKGNNLIRLGFRPQLAPGQSPAGAFSALYTLHVLYP